MITIKKMKEVAIIALIFAVIVGLWNLVLHFAIPVFITLAVIWSIVKIRAKKKRGR